MAAQLATAVSVSSSIRYVTLRIVNYLFNFVLEGFVMGAAKNLFIKT